MIKSKKNDLFEDLREETGALYISDLRHSPYHERAIQILSQECGGGYTISEWNEALEYLLLHEKCATVIEAQQVFAQAAKLL